MKLNKLLIAAAVAVGFSTGAMAEKVRMGIATEAYPPFAAPSASGEYTGWEIDLINAICAEAKLDCEIVATSWDGIIPSLTSEKIDVIAASMSITEDRLKVIDFSNKYYQTGASVVAANGSGITPTPEGLAGKTIGVQTATIHMTYAQKYFTDATIREYQTQDEANQDLFAGRIDATMADVLALEPFLKSAEGEACCADVGFVANDEAILGSGIGFGLRKGSDELKAKLNAAIDAIRANGTYEKFSSAYFDFNIFGE